MEGCRSEKDAYSSQEIGEMIREEMYTNR